MYIYTLRGLMKNRTFSRLGIANVRGELEKRTGHAQRGKTFYSLEQNHV